MGIKLGISNIATFAGYGTTNFTVNSDYPPENVTHGTRKRYFRTDDAIADSTNGVIAFNNIEILPTTYQFLYIADVLGLTGVGCRDLYVSDGVNNLGANGTLQSATLNNQNDYGYYNLSSSVSGTPINLNFGNHNDTGTDYHLIFSSVLCGNLIDFGRCAVAGSTGKTDNLGGVELRISVAGITREAFNQLAEAQRLWRSQPVAIFDDERSIILDYHCMMRITRITPRHADHDRVDLTIQGLRL